MSEDQLRALKAGFDDGVPRDMTMAELRAGDHVMIPGRVERIVGQGKFQNVVIVTDGLHFPWTRTKDKKTGDVNDAKTRIGINSRQCLKDENGGAMEQLEKALAGAQREVANYEKQIKDFKEEKAAGS